MCSVHSPHAFKKDAYFMCSTLSPHAFKNDAYFMCSALVLPHAWEIFSVFRELTSVESHRLLPGPPDSIGSDGVSLLMA